MMTDDFDGIFPTNKMFGGVSHQGIRLRSLDMGKIASSVHHIASLKLCQDIYLRAFSFD